MKRKLVLALVLLVLFGLCSEKSSASLGAVSPQVNITDSDIIPIKSITPIEGGNVTPPGVIEIAFSEVSLIGASFAVPETLKDDISSFRETIPRSVIEQLPVKLPSDSFLLATADSFYVVFAEHTDKGLARVEGWLLPTQIRLLGINASVVVAKSALFEKDGSPATLSEILANPEKYKFKLVKVNAYRKQISVLYDPDEPPYVEFPLAIGYLSEKPVELAIARKALERAKDMVFRIDEELVRDLLEFREPQGLWLFNFEYEHWYESQAVTNGIVIPSSHPIFTLFEQSIPVLGLLKAGSIILYDVKTDLPYEDVRSIIELKENGEKYLGKVIKLTANCYGGYISVQEVIEHNTPCGEDQAYVPDTGCINLVTDMRLEGFIAWNDVSVPPKRDELLLMVGVSSFHQDKQFVKASGSFELVGKVISSKEISASLPEDIALIIYDARKVGEIEFEKLAVQVKDEVKSRVGELHWALQNIYPYQKSPEIPFKIPKKVFWPKSPIFVTTPKELPEIVVEKNFSIGINTADAPISLNISNSHISNLSIKLKEVIRNVTIYFEKIDEKPPEVSSPPGLVYAYYKIDVNISETSIEKADITFWVLKEWLATQGATKDGVVMLRYHDGEWLRLPTRAIGENSTHFKFLAETPGFSIFAIAVETPTTTAVVTTPITSPIPTPTPTPKPTPGFEAIFAIAGLIAVSYLIRKKS